jgi:riboflavin transporter 2
MANLLAFPSGVRNRNLWLDLLAVLFGMASWISVNGLWVELPVIVPQLPENWALASYLSVIVQIANIGPITYALLRYQFVLFYRTC